VYQVGAKKLDFSAAAAEFPNFEAFTATGSATGSGKAST
jgi:hypothetical protein